MQLNGDRMEFFMGENKVVAQGNVSVIRDDVTLLCDKIEFYRDAQIAYAEGHVVLKRKEGEFTGDQLEFNFGTMQGNFVEANIYSKPFYGKARKISKVGENHMRMEHGYITTCDLDKPHYRFTTRKVDIYPGEKAVSRNVHLVVGKVPVIYIPRFTQDLSDQRPVLTFTPGYTKDWGTFLLTQYRYHLTDNVKGIVHLDYRERKGVAEGLDLKYTTPKFGEGLIRTYYTFEQDRGRHYHFYGGPTDPLTNRERFKGEWRHKWTIDSYTSAIWQYYKVKDGDKFFLHDYFRREADKDQNPPSYALITRRLPLGILSFRIDDRVNDFVDAIDRLPQIVYNIPNMKLADTGLYWKSNSTYSNLVSRFATPNSFKLKSMRLDQDQEISRPLKIYFFEVKPFVATEQTYYSRTPTQAKSDLIRGIFRTGADVSTKFYRIFDVTTNALGLNIHRLRHIITPSVAYKFSPDPTIPPSELPQFDEIDALTRLHTINFSIENKLQTKRELRSVDMVRLLVGSDFFLKENPGKGGFQNVTTKFEVKPYNWLAFYSDTFYNTVSEHLSSSSFDLYLNPTEKWSFAIGRRYDLDVDDQMTTEINYKVNQKWKLRIYERFDISGEGIKEQEYQIIRDLHCWEMELSFNESRGQGSEILMVFRLKDFPEIGFDFGEGFNKRKTGSQYDEQTATYPSR